jgi:hypothetical protein
MDGEELEAGEIPRRLEDGWHFRPDWRAMIVQRHLASIDPGMEPMLAIRGEEDSYIRQYYLFRRTGRSMNREAFVWAHQCYSNNRQTGAASLIRALTIAGVQVGEIAARMRTRAKSVAVFQRLYFDVSAYLEEKAWLAGLVFPPPSGSLDLADQRERQWMAAAFLGGLEALERSFSRKVALSNSEREELTSQIRSALTTRACDFVTSLQSGFVPPGPEDLDRLIRMVDATSRQPLPDDRDELRNAFMEGLHSILIEKCQEPELADRPELQEYRELAAAASAASTQEPPTDAGKAAGNAPSAGPGTRPHQ